LYRFVGVEVSDGVGWIVFRRVERLNALNSEFLEEVLRALDELEGRGDVRVIAITGEGRVFSAGADLSEVASAGSPEEAGRLFASIARLARRMLYVDKPLILALNGDAYGGGAELIWAADIVVSVESAKLVWAEARWGYNTPILPVVGPSVLGPSRTAMLAMTLEPLTAKEAHHIGLIARLAPDQKALREEVQRIAKSIMENSPQAIKSIKRLLRLAKLTPLLELGFSELERLARGSEAREAARAFVEKRKPEYKW
jgi:enoyl-CoA hydratase/3-hydroxyacyl-CoA dehydrogenase